MWYDEGMTAGVNRKSGKIHDISIPDTKFSYPAEELVRYLPDVTRFGCASKYKAHPKLMEDLKWSFNSKVFPNLKGNLVHLSTVKGTGKDNQT